MPCPFDETCLDLNCERCEQLGLYYLAKRLFIPKSLIPMNYQHNRVAELDIQGSGQSALKYLDNVFTLANEGKGLYAYGKEPGTGKTTICCIALMRYLYLSLKNDPYNIDNRRILYLNTPEFLERLRKSMNNQDLDLDKLLEELTNAETSPKLILLDDIGAEKSSEWVQERLYSLINFRVSNGLATLFTSNFSAEELEQRVGYRTYSRIIGCAKPIHFTGKDHRGCNW